MRIYTGILFIGTCLFAATTAENTYLVVLPTTIRPHTTLSVSVTYLTPVRRQLTTARLLAQIDGVNRTIAEDSKSTRNTNRRFGGRGRYRKQHAASQRENGRRSSIRKGYTRRKWRSETHGRRGFRQQMGRNSAARGNTPLDVDSVTTTTLKLQVPSNITGYSYFIVLEGSGSVIFKNETRLYSSLRSFATFVQTDKAMYKPGDTVKYRVFTVDGALDLVQPTLDIEFFDPKGNKIDERTGVSSLTGIDGELPLSDMPPLGQWRIHVESPDFRNAQTNYYFQVEEYVLPKFVVTVTLPPFGTVDDVSLKGSVKAMYTFGKPVDGHAELTFSKRYGSGFFDVRAIQISTAQLQNGEVTFDVPTEVLKRVTRSLKYGSIQVVANVTEEITGITLQGTGYVQYHESPYKIEFFPNMPDNFKPGFNPFKVLARVTDQDGRPPAEVTISPLAVDITVSYFTEKPTTAQFVNQLTYNFDVISPFVDGDSILLPTTSYPIQPDGKVEFGLDIPLDIATASIKAEFKGQTTYKDVRRFRSPSDVFLKVNLMSNGPLKVGDTAKVVLTASEGPAIVQYMITAKHLILTTGEIVITGSTNQKEFQISILRNMAPSARLVAYFVRPDGEIVADGINFVVEDMFENKVTIEFDQSQTVEPKTNVKLTVTADPNSQVSVLVVDRSVKLLREGNDITQDRVKQEIGRFGDFPYLPRGWGHIMPWPIAADDATDIFRDARLKVLTDAILYKFDLWSLNRPVLFRARSSMGFGGGMEMADGAAMGAAPSSAPQGQVRTEFPETWMWTSADANARGIAEFSSKAPDTITEWVANAFALNSQSGLGVASVTANLTTFLPFFVNVQLPYSVIRGELAVIQANVFNYHPQDLNVRVILKDTGEFVPVTIDNNGREVDSTGDQVKCVLVKSGTPTPVYFSVRPTIVGSMSVNIRISNQFPMNIFDEIVRTLPVKAEGEPKEMNFPILVSMQTSGVTTEVVPIVYPTSTVPQSQRIRVTIIGDLFGPSLENLDSLIKIPSGCGEQNMLNFAPAVFAADYMRVTGRFAANLELQAKIKKVLKTGYQRELIYQRRDGSFSAFGNADAEGSLWLTAFVMKSFAQAHKLDLVFIDPNVLEKAARYIFGFQTPDGFTNTGIVHHKAMQGASATNRRSLTAYVLIALQEVKNSQIITNQDTLRMLDTAIALAATSLTANQHLMTTDYEYAIGAYALRLLNDQNHIALLNNLENSPNRTIVGNSRYWKHPSSALQVEIAAYALLTRSLRRDINDGFAILDWLVHQRKSYGGFVSTQDTIVALQALSEYAALVYSRNVALSVGVHTVTAGQASGVQTKTLNTNNHDVLQYVDFAGDVDSVHIEAIGVGLAMVDVNVFYNVEQEPTPPSYTLTLTTSDETTKKFVLKACASFNIPNSQSNMAIMDIGAPSGFEAIKDLVAKSPIMKRVEMASGRLVIYFDEIPAQEVCVEVPMQRVSLVAGVKPANVIVYSYYEPSERMMRQYLPTILQQTSRLCDICGAECGCGPNSLSLPVSSC